MTTFSNTGATLSDFENCILGFKNEANYRNKENPYFGATIGPVANRLYEPNGIVLHGGDESWAFKEWKRVEKSHVTEFTLEKEDITAHVTYTLTKPSEHETQLEIEYSAKSKDAKSTPISMTNHSYFCLSENDATIDDHVIWLCNDHVIEHKDGLQSEPPTGELVVCEALEECKARENESRDTQNELQSRDNIYSLSKLPLDHTFAVNNDRLSRDSKLDTRDDTLVTVAILSRDNVSLTVKTTEPCFQVYTGDYNNVSQLSGESRDFGARSGVAIECSRPTNAWNVPEWKNWVDLGQGEYGAKIVYVLTKN